MPELSVTFLKKICFVFLVFFPVLLNASETEDVSDIRQKMINLYRSGRMKEALDIGSQSLQKPAESKLDKEEVFSVKWEMANINFLIGDYNQAEALLKESVKSFEELENRDDWRLMSVLQNLMYFYKSLGKTNLLKEVEKRIRKIAEKQIISEAEFSVFDYMKIGDAFKGLEMNEKAAVFYLKGLSRLKNDRDDKFTASLFHSQLGLLYMVQKNYEKAIEHYKILTNINAELPGKNQVSLANSLTDLGSAYLELKEYDQARNCFLKSRKIFQQAFGEIHSSLARICEKLGRVEQILENLEEAEKLYRQGIEIYKKLNSFKPNGSTDGMLMLYEIYLGRNQAEKTAEIRKILEVFFKAGVSQAKEKHKTKSSFYASSCKWLAILRMSLKEFEAAIPCLKISLRIYKQVYSENHPEVAQIYNNLGNAYYKLGQFENSEECFKSCEKILAKITGPDYPMRAVLLENYSQLLEAMGEAVEAEKMKLEAKRINSIR